eukprot:2518696-Ditylum_brightwellii.AAC.1
MQQQITAYITEIINKLQTQLLTSIQSIMSQSMTQMTAAAQGQSLTPASAQISNLNPNQQRNCISEKTASGPSSIEKGSATGAACK